MTEQHVGNIRVRSNVASFMRRYAKAMVLTFGAMLLLAIQIAQFSERSECQAYTAVDCSWQIDGAARLLQGEVSGRDYYFTYGVLGQAFHSIGSVLRPGARIIDQLPLLTLGVSLMAIALIVLILTTIPFADWRVSLFVMVINIIALETYTSARPLISTLWVVMLARVLALPSGRRRDLLCVGIGIFACVGQLVTFEIGFIVMISMCGLLAVLALLRILRRYLPTQEYPPLSELVRTGICIAGTYVAGNLLISLSFTLSSPTQHGFFAYQYYNLELVRGYTYTMVRMWTEPLVFTLVLIAITGYSIVAISVSIKRIPLDRLVLYLGLTILGLLQLKSLLVRSGPYHALLATTPIVCLLMLYLAESRLRWPLRIIGAIIALAFVVSVPHYNSPLRPLWSIAISPGSLIHRITLVQRYSAALDRYTSKAIANALDPQSKLLVYPNQNIIAAALGRENISPVLQAYAAMTRSLQQYYVDRIAAVQGQTEVIYCDPPKMVVDTVPNLTRTPLIFEYLLRNFDLKDDQLYERGCTVLRPRAVPRELPVTVQKFRQDARGSTQLLTLEAPAQCKLLRLTMTVTYPLTAQIGKPVPIDVTVLGTVTAQEPQRIVPFEVGRPFTTYLYLGASRSYHLFSPTRTTFDTERVTGLQISYPNWGLLAVTPSRVMVSEVGCISMNEHPSP